MLNLLLKREEGKEGGEMKVTEDDVILDIWDIRTLIELGHGTFSLLKLEEERRTMTRSPLHKLFYRLKYPAFRISVKEEK